jgi:serine/threonine-protein kinase
LTPTTLTPGSRLGPYEIVDLLGAGGMGEVYRAADTNLNRQVAIKVLPSSMGADGERLARFQREAEILAALNHPNIAHIHGLEKSDGTVALVMELVEGPTLAELIARGPIPIDEALSIAKQIAEALEAAHEYGIVHRDLKPANIKVKADGTAKVLDFGLAKAIAPVGARPDVSLSPTITTPAMTEAGIILGTAAYMSPEQAKGRAVDKRSDLWAFGVILYEMLTGQRPFGGEDVSDTLAQVLTKDVDWTALSPTIPSSIRRLLRRCLAKDRKRRIADASDARLEIDDASLTADGPGGAVVAPVSYSVWRRALPVVAAVTFIALAIGTVTTWRAMRTAPSAARGIVRLIIPPSTGESVGTVSPDPDVAISVDGRQVVYVGQMNGQTQLYVRALDRLGATVLRGLPTGFGAVRSPFLSPDGAWIGFWSNRILQKVPVGGGAPVIICPITATPRGASWGDRNNVIFATSAADTGLMEVSASGGTARVLTKPDLTKGEVDHVLPEVLPGGDAVLFTVTTRDPIENSQIAVLDLRTGQYRVVVRGGSNAHYAASGHLVYALRGALYAVAFDLDRLEVRSDPVLVVERLVTKPTGAGSFGVARDGTLVYLAGDAQSIAHTLVWVDRKGGEVPALAPTRGYFYVRLSPDGRRVAVDVRDGLSIDIWIGTFDGTLARLIGDRSANQHPVWTPDGLRVVYNTDNPSTLFWRAAGGTGAAQRLLESTTEMVAYSFSPDGTRLVVGQTNPTTGDDLYLLSLAEGPGHITTVSAKPLLATRFSERNAEVSPDGAWLAYQSDLSGTDEIYVQRFPDGDQGRFQISAAGGTHPLWAHSGRELFYLSTDGKLMAVPLTPDHSLMHGRAEVVVNRGYFQANSALGRSYDVSADGSRFLMIKDAAASTATAPQLVVVQNFFEELKHLVPAR